jgi:hypothetical protein
MDGRPAILLNAVVISDGLGIADVFVVLILNSEMIISC